MKQTTLKSNVKAMILAAGRGNRFRPLTDTLPKPLIPFCGKPLIEYHIEKLAAAGVQEIVINHAWLGQKLEAVLGDGARWQIKIHYSAEPEGGLETAGGIIQALPLLGEAPFIVVNGDVYTDMPFEPLLAHASRLKQSSEHLAHLVLVPSPEFNAQGDFGLSSDAKVCSKGQYTFSGVSVLHPELFADRPVEFLKLAPILRAAMERRQVSGELYNGFWSDIGTLERLTEAQKNLCYQA